MKCEEGHVYKGALVTWREKRRDVSRVMGKAIVALLVAAIVIGVRARPDQETMARFWGDLQGGTPKPGSGEGGVAEFFERVLEKEFGEKEAPAGSEF